MGMRDHITCGAQWSEIVRRAYGRVQVGHLEPNGIESWAGACAESRRAAHACLERV